MRVSLDGLRSWSAMRDEGVLIEVVPPGAWPRSARVEPLVGRRRPHAVSYIVQCWDRRVSRQAADLVVVRP